MVIACWLAAALAQAGDDPAALAKNLGADEFEVREDAEARLRKLGAAARPALEAAAKSPDLETRQRAAALLKGLGADDVWQGTVVTLPAGTRSVRAAFEELAARTGNPVRWKDNEPDAAATVTLDGKPRGYWEALQNLCASTGTAAEYPEDKRTAATLLGKGPPGKFPSAVVGPLRLRIESVGRQTRATRDFVEEELTVQDDMQILFELHWERKAAVCRHGGWLRILEARTMGGKDLAVARPEGRNVPLGVRRLQTRATFQHVLTPPAPADAKLAKLRVALDVTIASDFATFSAPFRADGAGAAGGWSARLGFLDPAGKECQLTLRRPEALGLPQAAPDLADESVELVGANDRMALPHRMVEHSAQETRYVFVPPRGRFEPRQVEVRAARTRSTRTIEFVFENVPLLP